MRSLQVRYTVLDIDCVQILKHTLTGMHNGCASDKDKRKLACLESLADSLLLTASC